MIAQSHHPGFVNLQHFVSWNSWHSPLPVVVSTSYRTAFLRSPKWGLQPTFNTGIPTCISELCSNFFLFLFSLLLFVSLKNQEESEDWLNQKIGRIRRLVESEDWLNQKIG